MYEKEKEKKMYAMASQCQVILCVGDRGYEGEAPISIIRRAEKLSVSEFDPSSITTSSKDRRVEP